MSIVRARSKRLEFIGEEDKCCEKRISKIRQRELNEFEIDLKTRRVAVLRCSYCGAERHPRPYAQIASGEFSGLLVAFDWIDIDEGVTHG